MVAGIPSISFIYHIRAFKKLTFVTAVTLPTSFSFFVLHDMRFYNAMHTNSEMETNYDTLATNWTITTTAEP
jgi:hypothetical protein